MLATDLPRSHLPGRSEGELERPLGARGEGVDLIPRVPPELLELTAHPIHVRAGPPEHLRRHVVAGDDAGQQVIRPDSSRPGRPGRSLPRAHDGLLGLPTERLEWTPLTLALLLHQVLEHREWVEAADSAPNHDQIPSTLRAQVVRDPLPTLLPKDLHARRPDPTVLTYHPLKPPETESGPAGPPPVGIYKLLKSKSDTLIFYYFFGVHQGGFDARFLGK